MECYQCLQAGVTREAAGLCHHCSAALCADHIRVIEDPIELSRLLTPSTELPKRGRIMLCDTCKAAFEQPLAGAGEFASHARM
jgi:hypothetical protein